MQPTCVIQFVDTDGKPHWLEFVDPVRVIEAGTVDAVLPALRAAEAAIAEGLCVAGYMTYEAAGGLDPVLRTAPKGSLPLLRFGVYAAARRHDEIPFDSGDYRIGDWTSSISGEAYGEAIRRIKDWIAQGDTYQVNYTLRLRAAFEGDPTGWFHALYRAQRPRYAAYMTDGVNVLCSVSPELFFSLQKDVIRCRPMKGTARRGLTWKQDGERAVQLEHSAKNRAENLMIVDMMRNDLGRIARIGTVQTESLFDVERYPTVLQMTSSIRAETTATFSDIMTALFPSSSITGAPKVRTMQIIRELESEPRGIYTGAIGFFMPHHPVTRAPGRHAQFNVAIRTAHIRMGEGVAEYGTGGGIVWDSEADLELKESQTKALILQTVPHAFSLLETMLWKPGTGIFLLEAHLRRLEESALYFGYRFDQDRVREALQGAVAILDSCRYRVRLLLDETGKISVETRPVERERKVWRVVVDDRPTAQDNPLLYHKTTQRNVYEAARARHPNADDVILWNERGEITESCVANVLVRLDNVWYTPPIACGLLNGTLRATLVRRGRVREKVMSKADLARAERILLINSVRGCIPALLG